MKRLLFIAFVVVLLAVAIRLMPRLFAPESQIDAARVTVPEIEHRPVKPSGSDVVMDVVQPEASRDERFDLAALSLKGVRTADAPAAMRAVIEMRGQGAADYGPGDRVPGGAVVDAILFDRVILQHAGRYYTLRLQAGPAQAERAGAEASRQTLAALRDAAFTEPDKVLAILDASPVLRDGQQIGYRIYPPEIPELLDTLGLEPGDVVTAINSVQLESSEQLQRALAGLLVQSQFELTIYRNGILEKLVMGMP